MSHFIKTVFVGASVLSFVLSMPVQAGDVQAGKAKSGLCAGCHGQNGQSLIPSYPNLAGQNEKYLLSALNAYKNKERTGGQAQIMTSQASALSDNDMADLAAYFSSL